MYMIFFSSVGTFGGLAPPPPPQYQKAGYTTAPTPSALGETGQGNGVQGSAYCNTIVSVPQTKKKSSISNLQYDVYI